jgi:hypothetical protein
MKLMDCATSVFKLYHAVVEKLSGNHAKDETQLIAENEATGKSKERTAQRKEITLGRLVNPIGNK